MPRVTGCQCYRTGSSGLGGSSVFCAAVAVLVTGLGWWGTTLGHDQNLVGDPVGGPIPQKPIRIKTRLLGIRRRASNTPAAPGTLRTALVRTLASACPTAALVRIRWGRGLRHLWPRIPSPVFPPNFRVSRSLHFLTCFLQPRGPVRSAGSRDIKCACAE